MRDELKETIEKFVDGLTPEEIKEQLKLAYLQMERCKQVLNGADVEPVEMMDNGLSSDLELFYSCKKRAAECACLSKAGKRDDNENEESVHVEIHVSNPEGMYLEYRDEKGELKYTDFITHEAAHNLADRIYQELELYKNR